MIFRLESTHKYCVSMGFFKSFLIIISSNKADLIDLQDLIGI